MAKKLHIGISLILEKNYKSEKRRLRYEIAKSFHTIELSKYATARFCGHLNGC
jgi:hypothetical protein